MPERLTIKRPKPLGKIAAWTLAIPLALLVNWLCRAIATGTQIHFEHPLLNLGVHLMLVAGPVLLAMTIACKPLTYQDTEETVLCQSSYVSTFRASWWTLLLVWPPGIFAVLVLVHDSFTQYLPQPASLSTGPWKALLIMVVALLLSLLYAAMFLNRFGVRVSAEGIRPGMLRFFQWEGIHHVSREGDVYGLYHQVNPELPAAFIPLNQPELRAKFDQMLTEHNVPISNSKGRVLQLTKIAVVAAAIANLLLSIWLWKEADVGITAIIGISTVIALGAGLALDYYRKLTKVPKLMPIMDK